MKINREIDDSKNLKKITLEVGKGNLGLDKIIKILGGGFTIKEILQALRVNANFREAYIDGLDRYRIECVQSLVDAAQDKELNVNVSALRAVIASLKNPDFLPDFIESKDKDDDLTDLLKALEKTSDE